MLGHVPVWAARLGSNILLSWPSGAFSEAAWEKVTASSRQRKFARCILAWQEALSVLAAFANVFHYVDDLGAITHDPANLGNLFLALGLRMAFMAYTQTS